jgi:hypothetical protein
MSDTAHEQGQRQQQPDAGRETSVKPRSGADERERTQAIQRDEQERNRENQHDGAGGPPNTRD